MSHVHRSEALPPTAVCVVDPLGESELFSRTFDAICNGGDKYASIWHRRTVTTPTAQALVPFAFSVPMNGSLPADVGVWRFPARPDTRRHAYGVVDGDTLDMTLDRGLDTRTDKRLRLYGVDTAEIYGTSTDSAEYERGQKHEMFVVKWIDERWPIANELSTWPFTVYTLYDLGKYGRPLADITDANGESLVAALFGAFGDEIRYDG